MFKATVSSKKTGLKQVTCWHECGNEALKHLRGHCGHSAPGEHRAGTSEAPESPGLGSARCQR